MSYFTLVEPVIAIARDAAAAIIEVYERQQTIAVTAKTDDSPLTEADLAAHRVIAAGLEKLTPDIPLLSEESGEQASWEVRRGWSRYWLVDPLDGTKEFIKRSGDFTVNIALIDNGVPVLGVVCVPASSRIYAGCSGHGSFRVDGHDGGKGERRAIRVRSLADARARGEPVTVVGSKSHAGERMPVLMALIERELGATTLTSMGSSLKICMVAEGAADIYPRLGPTSEWDTAAAQAVVEAAGGVLLGADLRPLRYNRKDSLLNPDFYVLGDTLSRWKLLQDFTAQ